LLKALSGGFGIGTTLLLFLAMWRLLLNLKGRNIIVRLLIVAEQVKKCIRGLLAPRASKKLLLIRWG
jgi:hypothetical protein